MKSKTSMNHTPVANLTISGVVPDTALTMVSTSATGVAADGLVWSPAISPDGTKVVFYSSATNLVSGDTNGLPDMFVKDLNTGTVSLISSSAGAAQSYMGDNSQLFSPDSSKVVYVDSTGSVFVKNLSTGTDFLVSASAGGEAGNGYSFNAIFSPDGTKVAFYSDASNLVDGDNNGTTDIFVKDLNTGAVTRIPLDYTANSGLGHYGTLSFSPDGTHLAFSTDADQLVQGDSNGASDVFVANLVSGEVSLVSSDASGIIGGSTSFKPVFSPDGKSIAFGSLSSNLIADDSNPGFDTFLKDLATGQVTVLSTDGAGHQISGSSQAFIFSPDGKYGAFVADAGLLTGTPTGGQSIYLKNMTTGELTLVPGGFPDGYINGGNTAPSFSADSKSLVFDSYAEYQDGNGAVTESFGVFVYKIGGTTAPVGETLKGGRGNDTATYETSHASVTVDLRHRDGSANTGDAFNDKYVSIENFKLSTHDDSFFGANFWGSKNVAFGLDGWDKFVSGGVGTTNIFDGGNGDDTFVGGKGSDTFIGGAGNDLMTGGGGYDHLTGGAGADVFVFNAKEKGSEAITDFQLGVDKLQFHGITAHDLSIHVAHGHVYIQIHHGATITLDGVTDISALQHDFLFL